jgi:hypothetical protein
VKDLDEPTLFVGCLPGSDRRQIILFPGGRVLADLLDQQIETQAGDLISDSGWSAATALIQELTSYGWYVDEINDATISVWLKPRAGIKELSNIRIREMGALSPELDR